jgi:hypothetical protein
MYKCSLIFGVDESINNLLAGFEPAAISDTKRAKPPTNYSSHVEWFGGGFEAKQSGNDFGLFLLVTHGTARFIIFCLCSRLGPHTFRGSATHQGKVRGNHLQWRRAWL